MARVQTVIARIAETDSIATFEKLGAEVRIGAPRFVSANEFELDSKRRELIHSAVLAMKENLNLSALAGMSWCTPLSRKACARQPSPPTRPSWRRGPCAPQ